MSAGPRARLVNAMTQVVADRGYRATSVAQVAAAAGASRATFYQHFRSREDCFLVAYRDALERIAEICSGALSDEHSDPDRILTALAATAVADPARARLVLIEALAGPAALRAEHQRLLLSAEREILDNTGCDLRLPPGALQGGLIAVFADTLLADRAATLGELLPDLGAWARSYRVPAGAAGWDRGVWDELGRRLTVSPAVGTGPARRPLLPRGRSALSGDLSAAERRRRILEATTEVTAAKGYAAATVADVVAAARVTRGAFYSHFRCKSDAFLAALTDFLQESIAATAKEFSLGKTWPERVWRGMAAFLAYVAANPHGARAGVVEIHAAGEAAIMRARENRLAFTLFLADGYQQEGPAGRLPALCSEAITGAIEGILRHRLLAGRAERSLELLPQCAYVALAPFMGPRDALDFVRSNPPVGVPAA